MDNPEVKLVVLLLLSGVAWSATGGGGGGQTSASFNNNYEITWGYDHVLLLNGGAEVQLSFDASSGSGFASKLSYGSGLISISMKLSNKAYTGGLVTTLFMSSNTNNHDELDIEILGHDIGQPYTIQTNIFVNGVGGREQRITPWFDPSTDFHTYSILWNLRQVVFSIDNTPIRVFKNNQNIGVPYLTQPMQIITSLWNGDTWATDGGRSKMNYAYAPFDVQFEGFGINGCPVYNNDIQSCYSSQYWWNSPNYWQLSSTQQSAYDNVKRNYMNYNYCTDRSRYPTPPPECATQ
ncbi:hypothetical protein Nepgr_004330 [Nepenthes gracilis]|uniref:Xyloglucan endotransglucosylase/hydrolase n=1 Tax=Nepenthes gracilis TaxID=150966 RepID=A0AAD3XF72_NEPGR|nr:hypothetical protein Nepgr_004330 [Nepenthes gracilis]